MAYVPDRDVVVLLPLAAGKHLLQNTCSVDSVELSGEWALHFDAQGAAYVVEAGGESMWVQDVGALVVEL